MYIKGVVHLAKKGTKRPSPTENQHSEVKNQKKKNEKPFVPEKK